MFQTSIEEKAEVRFMPNLLFLLNLEVSEIDFMLSRGNVVASISKLLQYAYISNLFEVVVT